MASGGSTTERPNDSTPMQITTQSTETVFHVQLWVFYEEVGPSDRERGWQLRETRKVTRWDEILQVKRHWELANEGWTRSLLRIEECQRFGNGQFFAVNRL